VTLPQIIGTFQGIGADYVLYRTDIGSGACAGGSLYVIKFAEDLQTGKLSGVTVSPVLTTCLGEYTIFGFRYNNEGQTILTVINHSINLDLMSGWIENKKTPVQKKKSK
jgi:hypothetical protein